MKTILYGATLYALGYAMRDPANTLILEPTGLVASEFADALRFCFGHTPQSAPAKRMLSELVRRKAADDTGRAHIPAVAPVAVLLAKECGVKILFHSQIIGRTETPDGVEVQALCINQRRTFSAERFIDTTSNLDLLRENAAIADICFNALLRSEKVIEPYTQGNFAVSPTFFDDCAVLSMQTAQADTFAQRRESVHNFMRNLPAELAGCKLLSTSSTLCVTAKPCDFALSERSRFRPCCGHNDYLHALDCGFEDGGDTK